MYNCNTDSLGLILGVEVFFSEGHCSGALCRVIVEQVLSLRHFLVDIYFIYIIRMAVRLIWISLLHY